MSRKTIRNIFTFPYGGTNTNVGTVRDVSATLPLVSSGGATPNISLQSQADGNYALNFASGVPAFVPIQGEMVGSYKAFATTTIPTNFLWCNGATVLIATYPDLFAVIGNTFGGDGITNFVLPDLQDRLLKGDNGSNIGTSDGANTLFTNQLPQHRHDLLVNNDLANTNIVTGNYLSSLSGAGEGLMVSTSTNLQIANSNSIGLTGSGLPHEHPHITVRWAICFESVGISGAGPTPDFNAVLGVSNNSNIRAELNGIGYATLNDILTQLITGFTATNSPILNTDNILQAFGKAQGQLNAKENSISIGTNLQYFRGDKTFQNLNKSAVLLPNVDNTSDTNKPVSTAQAAADALILSQAQAYADNLAIGLIDLRGGYNASANLFPSTGGSGTAGAILKGDIWYVTVAGTLGGVAVTQGDTILAIVDSPAQIPTNWNVNENNLGYVPENVTNKVTAIIGNENSNIFYPTVKAIYDYVVATFATITNLALKENSANKNASGGYVGLTLFNINFKNVANTVTSFFTNLNTAARTYSFQDRDGTIADNTDLATKLTKTANLSDIANPTTTLNNILPTQTSNANKVLQTDGTNTSWVDTINFNRPRKTNEVFTDFLSGITGTIYTTSINGGGATCNAVNNFVANENGVILPNTGTTNTGRAGIISTNLQCFTGGIGVFTTENLLQIGILSDAVQRYQVYSGFGDIATARPNNGVYFRYDDTVSPNWLIESANNGTRTTTITTVAVNLNYVKLRVVFDVAIATFFIDDVNVGTLNTNLPIGLTRLFSSIPCNMIKSVGNTTRSIRVDYNNSRTDLTTAR